MAEAIETPNDALQVLAARLPIDEALPAYKAAAFQCFKAMWRIAEAGGNNPPAAVLDEYERWHHAFLMLRTAYHFTRKGTAA